MPEKVVAKVAVKGIEKAAESFAGNAPLAPAAAAGRNGYALDAARTTERAARGSQLFDPVRPALERVERKLRSSESTRFSPLSNAFISLIGSGGKRLRPVLALLAWGVGTAENSQVGHASKLGMAQDNRAQGLISQEAISADVIALAASVEMLHTSTLVHDDVIDGALLRRGAPTLNATWSGGSTVLAGNYMFGVAAEFAAETASMPVIHIFSDTLKVIVDGELQQLLDRYNYDQPGDNYFGRIYAKTASLFCAATEGGAILAGLDDAATRALYQYGYNLGMAFQIVDDILDFTGDADSLGKPAGSDLNQGTLTLPFFHFLRNHADRAAIVQRLEAARDRADEGEILAWRALVQQMAQEVRLSDAIETTRLEARRFVDLARANLAPFSDNIYKQTMLALCDFVLERTY